MVVIELHELVHQSHELPALLPAERRCDLVLRSIHGLLHSRQQMSAGRRDVENLGAAIALANRSSDETFVFQALYDIADRRTVESDGFHQTGLIV